MDSPLFSTSPAHTFRAKKGQKLMIAGPMKPTAIERAATIATILAIVRRRAARCSSRSRAELWGVAESRNFC